MPPLLSIFSSIHAVLHSTAFAVAWNAAILLAAVVWLGLGFWVFRDARRRSEDGRLVGAATLLALVPPYVGPLVYLLFRPTETLADARARRAELRTLEERLARGRCPTCGSATELDFLVCPVCTARLREACAGCEAPLEPLWQACPYCARPAKRARAGILSPAEPPSEPAAPRAPHVPALRPTAGARSSG